ncbi:MAG: hypothetical protein K0U66_02015 [Gammaproteobacteria bacterium]|nr:hypothetical protein [Gammaproteobacteria bacterium]
MPAWNHRYLEISLWGLPLNLIFYLIAAAVCLVLSAAMALGGGWPQGLMLAALSVVAGHGFWRKLRLGRKRAFEQVVQHEQLYRASRYNDEWETDLNAMKDYEKRKLPQRLHQGCMLNDDGSVTVALCYDGFALYLDDNARAQAHDCIRSVLDNIEKKHVFEFHLCRQPDQRQSEAYKNVPIHRQHRVTRWIRGCMAGHVAAREYRNCVFVFITTTAEQRGWLGAARTLKEQAGAVEPLLALATEIMRKLPGGHIDTASAYRHVLATVNDNRCAGAFDSLGRCAGWFAGGRIHESDGRLRLADGRWLKSLWFENYPEARVGFICRLTQAPASIHIVQGLKPVSVIDRQAIQRDINITASMASGASLAGARIKLQAHTDMQAWCAKDDGDIYWNFFAVQIIDADPERVDKLARRIQEQIATQGGLVRDYSDIQFAAWHYLLPGAGHCARRWRIDETEQLTAMAPVHVPAVGAQTALSLRLSTQNTPVNIGYRRGDVAHHVTIAMTGAGKSLDRCARILESYGTGIDIYALEIGQSLWWAIEAVGGQYHRLDPDEVMINPMPDRSCCHNGELPIDMLATTTTALSMLLTGGAVLDQFEMTATQAAMRAVYANADLYPTPTISDMLVQLQNLDHDRKAIVTAATRLSDHLGAFLESAEGQRLVELPQLSMRPGAIGCDLSRIKEKAPRLLKFYLVFIALKFSQLACASRNPAEIVLDEMHEFVHHAPEVVGALIDGIARMGRKNANYINIITQEEGEIEAIGRSVLNQITRKCLLYKQADHNALAARIGMPAPVARAWRAWRNPLALDYRYALECIDGEQWHELFLQFPEEISILSRTDPASLDLKHQISATITDPVERVRVFAQRSREMLAENNRHSA